MMTHYLSISEKYMAFFYSHLNVGLEFIFRQLDPWTEKLTKYANNAFCNVFLHLHLC